MKTVACPKSSLVEALYDGRLDAQDGASVERHLPGCHECGALARDLDQIRAAIRAPLAPATPLEHQRARVALLEHAAREPAPLQRRPPAFVALAAAMLALAAVLGFTGGRFTAPSRPLTALHTRKPPRLTVPSETSIRPSADASFERTRNGGLEVLTLRSGTIDVTVRPLRPDERFVVKTTDAEIDVHATALRVEADGGRIRAVSVTEGAVDVRYAGFTAVIPSGGSWRANGELTWSPPPTTTSSLASPVGAPRGKAGAHPAPPSRLRALSSPQAAVEVQPAPPASAPATQATEAVQRRTTSAEFAAAMQALGRGEYSDAAVQLQAFAVVHPDDARADEADYLRTIALQRAGRTAEAQTEARRYLASRPAGAHRSEVKKIAAP